MKKKSMSREEKIELFSRLVEEEALSDGAIQPEPEIETTLEEAGEFYRNRSAESAGRCAASPVKRRLTARTALIAAVTVIILAAVASSAAAAGVLPKDVIAKAVSAVARVLVPEKEIKGTRSAEQASDEKSKANALKGKPVAPRPSEHRTLQAASETTETTSSPNAMENNPVYAPIIAALRSDSSGIIPPSRVEAVIAHISRVLVSGDWARLDWSRFTLNGDTFDGAAALLRKGADGKWRLVAAGTNLLRSSYPESPDELWASVPRIATSLEDDPDRIAVLVAINDSDRIAPEMKTDGYVVDYVGIKGDWAFVRIHAKKYRLGAGIIAKRTDSAWGIYYIGDEGLSPDDHPEVPPEIFK